MLPTVYLDKPPFGEIPAARLASGSSSLPVRLTMKRIGKFTVGECADDTTQCGFKGTRTLDYKVVIEGSPEHLTKEGFLIDNFAVQRYFDDTYKSVKVFLSCERIAIKAVEDIRRMVGVGVKAVEVTVDGTGLAGLTASWRADGKDVPVAGAL